MKSLLTLITIFFCSAVNSNPISCDVTELGNVLVQMDIPHPAHALVHRPDGETIWLQTSADFSHKQIHDFSDQEMWYITKESKGTVWVNDKAIVKPIIQGKGEYHLYIAENIETEPENTHFIECYFTVE